MILLRSGFSNSQNLPDIIIAMTELFSSLRTLDRSLFFFLNLALANSFFDYLMVLITDKHTWYLPGAILFTWLVWRGGKAGRIMALLVIVGIVLSDQISAGILKPLTEQFRPCKELEGFRLLVHCGSRYGFPSSHAANAAVIATLMSYAYRRWTAFWVIITFLIGFSRIYVGVHYPSDVAGGWVLGIALGLALIPLFEKLQRLRWSKTKPAA